MHSSVSGVATQNRFLIRQMFALQRSFWVFQNFLDIWSVNSFLKVRVKKTHSWSNGIADDISDNEVPDDDDDVNDDEEHNNDDDSGDKNIDENNNDDNGSDNNYVTDNGDNNNFGDNDDNDNVDNDNIPDNDDITDDIFWRAIY